jgi:hypothetical protein
MKESSVPPIATAVPVSVSSYDYPNQQQPQHQGQGQGQDPHATVVESVPVQNQQYQNAEPAPICRGCGRAFVRPPGVHDGQSQYFRCEECNRTTIANFCVIM